MCLKNLTHFTTKLDLCQNPLWDISKLVKEELKIVTTDEQTMLEVFDLAWLYIQDKKIAGYIKDSYPLLLS